MFYAKKVLDRAIKEKNIAFLMLGDVHNMLGNYTDALQLVDSTLFYSEVLQNQIMQINGLKVKGNIF